MKADRDTQLTSGAKPKTKWERMKKTELDLERLIDQLEHGGEPGCFNRQQQQYAGDLSSPVRESQFAGRHAGGQGRDQTGRTVQDRGRASGLGGHVLVCVERHRIRFGQGTVPAFV